MTIQVSLPDDLVAEIDTVSADRGQFIAAAVRRILRENSVAQQAEVERINEIADELNREAADVLEYQTFS
jgi:metal-responsive CopG/Arc/MetJ family transcriptional regulator